MQCPACHNEVASESSAFCNHCGAPLSAPCHHNRPARSTSARLPRSLRSHPPPPALHLAAASSGAQSQRRRRRSSYITFIPAVLFLILEPYKKMPSSASIPSSPSGSPSSWFAFWIVMAIFSMFLAIIPVIRTMAIFLVPFVYFVFGICVFIMWLLAIIKASKGE